jgi:ribosome-associated translation inhibitor RaiA
MQIALIHPQFSQSESINLAVQSAVLDRLHALGPDRVQKVKVALSMDNSQLQRGPDRFRCRVELRMNGLPFLMIQTVSMDLYHAISLAGLRLWRTLNRQRIKRLRGKLQRRKVVAGEQGSSY